MTVNSAIENDVGVVVVRGEVDLATVSPLRDAIAEHLASGCTHLLLDLTGVTFIDSTGLGVLVGTSKKARGLGGSLRVVCQNPRILRLLAITGLTKTLAVHEDQDTARADWPLTPA